MLRMMDNLLQKHSTRLILTKSPVVIEVALVLLPVVVVLRIAYLTVSGMLYLLAGGVFPFLVGHLEVAFYLAVFSIPFGEISHKTAFLSISIPNLAILATVLGLLIRLPAGSASNRRTLPGSVRANIVALFVFLGLWQNHRDSERAWCGIRFLLCGHY
jgi:hypothetical protein